jgi:hypothetical protein
MHVLFQVAQRTLAAPTDHLLGDFRRVRGWGLGHLHGHRISPVSLPGPEDNILPTAGTDDPFLASGTSTIVRATFFVYVIGHVAELHTTVLADDLLDDLRLRIRINNLHGHRLPPHLSLTLKHPPPLPRHDDIFPTTRTPDEPPGERAPVQSVVAVVTKIVLSELEDGQAAGAEGHRVVLFNAQIVVDVPYAHDILTFISESLQTALE